MLIMLRSLDSQMFLPQAAIFNRNPFDEFTAVRFLQRRAQAVLAVRE